MPLFIEKPTIATIQAAISPQEKNLFADWQSRLNSKATTVKGFVSLEFSTDPHDQHLWLIVQRFVNAEAASAWLNSTDYLQLIADLQPLIEKDTFKQIENNENNVSGNTTEVIVTEVNPEKEDAYRAWTAKIHRAEAKFPGFCGVYVQSPAGHGKHWITLLQFDTRENLDHWLQSKERNEVLQESVSLISSLETHRVISPYAGWFASIAKTGELPSTWKQTMLVLLVLFPIVMVELKFLNPLTAPLNSSFATFIGNFISVTLIAFPFLPIAIKGLGWWLSTHNTKTTYLGFLVVLALYAAEIALFWNFL